MRSRPSRLVKKVRSPRMCGRERGRERERERERERRLRERERWEEEDEELGGRERCRVREREREKQKNETHTRSTYRTARKATPSSERAKRTSAMLAQLEGRACLRPHAASPSRTMGAACSRPRARVAALAAPRRARPGLDAVARWAALVRRARRIRRVQRLFHAAGAKLQTFERDLLTKLSHADGKCLFRRRVRGPRRPLAGTE